MRHHGSCGTRGRLRTSFVLTLEVRSLIDRVIMSPLAGSKELQSKGLPK